MDFQELALSRQSCRSFSARELPQDELTACLEAARIAPSACNAQPFRITACTGTAAHDVAKLTQSMGMNKFTDNVPCMLVIEEDSYNVTAAAGSKLKNQDYRSIDIGIAAAHIVLCAASRGLATCILGWFDEKALQSYLGTSSRIRLIIALGYASDDDTLRPKKRKAIEEIADFR